MLTEMIKNGFGKSEDYNCAETILYGANIAYDLKLDKESLKLSSAFGGGMGIESTCGVVTGAMMVLGRLFTEDVQHQSTTLRPLTNEFMMKYKEAMGSIECEPLKEKYRTNEVGCALVILESAKILDEIIVREKGKR